MIEKINKLSPLMCFLIGLGLAGFTYFNSGEGLERLQSSVVNAQNEWDRQQEEVKSAQAIANDKAKFEEELKNKIAELYDPGFEFKHDPEAKYCEHCHS